MTRMYKINDNRIMQIELLNLLKKYLKTLVFWKFQRILLKTILNERFQFIYLQNIFFKWFDSISFVFNFQEMLFTLIVLKEFITKF